MDSYIKHHIPDHLVGIINQYEHYSIKLCKVNSVKFTSEYYLMALYKHSKLNTYFLMIDSGKFGHKFTNEFFPFFDAKLATKKFNDNFYSKTENDFESCHTSKFTTFVHKPNKFKVLPYDTFVINHDSAVVMAFLSNILKICAQNIFYCGSLDRSTEILNYINDNIKTISQQELVKLSTEYYEIIPTKKAQLISAENIADMLIQNESKQYNKDVHSIIAGDDFKLPYVISEINRNDIDFKYICSYMGRHKPTNIFRINHQFLAKNDSIPAIPTISTDDTQRMLLWHGTGNGNVFSILYNGLKLSNRSGLMFGNGIYLADHIDKSLGYCSHENHKMLLLCSIGTKSIQPHVNADHGLHSAIDKSVIVKGVGSIDPNEFNCYSIKCENENKDENKDENKNIIIPSGKYARVTKHYLTYNEYVIYDPSLIKIHYVVIINS